MSLTDNSLKGFFPPGDIFILIEDILQTKNTSGSKAMNILWWVSGTKIICEEDISGLMARIQIFFLLCSWLYGLARDLKQRNMI